VESRRPLASVRGGPGHRRGVGATARRRFQSALGPGRFQPRAAGTHALVADPRAFLPRLDLGTLAARAGDYAAAARWFSEAVAIEPRSDDAHANLGATLLAQGELDAAGRELDRAIELDDRNPVALQNRAVLALKRGERDQARRLLLRGIAIDPSNARLRHILDGIPAEREDESSKNRG